MAKIPPTSEWYADNKLGWLWSGPAPVEIAWRISLVMTQPLLLVFVIGLYAPSLHVNKALSIISLAMSSHCYWLGDCAPIRCWKKLGVSWKADGIMFSSQSDGWGVSVISGKEFGSSYMQNIYGKISCTVMGMPSRDGLRPAEELPNNMVPHLVLYGFWRCE